MGKAHWCYDSEKKKAKYSRENIYYCHIFHPNLT
jgi:hypothetical protein